MKRKLEELSEDQLAIRQLVSNERKEHEQYVKDVSQKLLMEQAPLVGKKLVEIVQSLQQEDERLEFVESWMTVFIHFHGVNFRFLGMIRKDIPDVTYEQVRQTTGHS